MNRSLSETWLTLGALGLLGFFNRMGYLAAELFRLLSQAFSA
ncbi:hypothetical protein SAMN05216593_12712 [Pseudomonas asturiensis]|uniref:Uncharacterized protein n=1 Tax=Pseudomonas asturiensis TaxID=1190415 RepID=A0A1M7QI77_9PSED|nr:hypothetical protein SAMN05216593_12712 [Pseudomonas asturiensis]